jgi:DNA repair exonuclease SbcCD nuclease subunit
MSKVAIIGDKHLGHSKSADKFHDYFAKSCDFMFDYFEEHGIEHIIQTGDLFDYRREVHFNTLYRSNIYFFDKVFDKKNGYVFHVLAGNHDALFTNTNKINSVRLLLKNTPTNIIDATVKTVNIDGLDIDFYPWINQNNKEECLKYAKNTTSKVAIGHFEFALFPLSPGNEAESGMDHKAFSQYDIVFSGHYHTQSKKDNVQYTGTPYELTWVDCDDPKGFWVLDTETLEYTFVQNPYTIFKRIDYVEGMKFDFADVKDHFVKLVVVQKEDQKKFDKFLATLNASGAHDVKVIESSYVAAVSAAVGKQVDAVSTLSVIDSVIQELNTPLDKAIIKQKIMSLYQEATNISNTISS